MCRAIDPRNLSVFPPHSRALPTSLHVTAAPLSSPPPSILERLLRRNSMAALELHVTANPEVEPGSSEGGAAPSLLGGGKDNDVVAMRSGEERWG